jgi:hypothetical protein
MKTIVLKIPQYFNHNTFDTALNKQDIFDDIQKDPCHIIFDVSETKHISVLGLLLIAQIADRVMKSGYKCSVHYGKPKQESHMAWFARIMGLVNGNADEGIKEYLDSFRVEIQRCHNGKESLAAVNKLIPIIKREINPSESVLKALNWALWELVDNAGAHGYGIYDRFDINYINPVYFCAFDYKELIDIAIIDTGKGIHKSFLSSGKEKYKNILNEDALRLAIQDKESGHPKGSPGFGLFGCSEIAKQSKGELVIISGVNKLVLSKDCLNIVQSGNFDGTMVLLSIPQKLDLNLEKIFGKDSNIILESIDDLLGGVK